MLVLARPAAARSSTRRAAAISFRSIYAFAKARRALEKAPGHGSLPSAASASDNLVCLMNSAVRVSWAPEKSPSTFGRYHANDASLLFANTDGIIASASASRRHLIRFFARCHRALFTL